MIQFENLKKSYGGDLVFEDLTLTIGRGERCGLVGRNGSGKTTLLRMLVGEETPDEGNISLPKNYTLGYLNQHIHFSQPTVREEAALALRPEESDMLYKVEKILFGLGLKDEDMDRSPQMLSGGYHLRLHLAKVLIAEPDCLLLDEPTNYLDIVSIRWLERFLKNWKGEIIIISHDRGFMDSVTTHTIGLHRKKLLKVNGGTEQYFSQIVQQEEIYEKTRNKLETKKEHAEAFIKRFGAKASKATQANARKKAIARMPVLDKLAQLEDLDFNFRSVPFYGENMVRLQDVSFAYNPEVPLIQNMSIEIANEERIAIIGKNGRGKSTLLNIIAKEIANQEGVVKISDKIVMGYFGQTNIDRLHPQHTIEEEVGIANKQLNITEIKTLCGQMMFPGDKAKKPIRVLSGGERSRVLLAKILATPCNLLLLDEPTHHLDMESIEALVEAVDNFPGTVIIVTHSEVLLNELPLTQLVICKESEQTVFQGTYEEFLERVGWDDELSGSKKAEKIKAERRSKEAQDALEKQKQLKQVKKQIEQTESAIIRLESELEPLNAALAKTPQDTILGKKISDIYAEIDALMNKLESLHKESL
jgi:ATP-binding cassette subfamily F protein 3